MSLKDFNFFKKIPRWINLYARGNLTVRSLVALGLIAVLNLCSFLISQDNGREQYRALGEIQRGRLHLQSLQLLKREIYVAQTIPSESQLKQETQNIVRELRKLKDEARSIWGLGNSNSFFQDLQNQETFALAQRIDKYISNMTKILNDLEKVSTSDRALVATLLFELINQVRAYETDCEQFIQLYILQLEEMLQEYRFWGLFIFGLTILMLLIVAIFIFRPAIIKLEKARNARSIFFSKMSHEIRNPMNSIIGMSKIMLETSLDARQRDLLMRLDLSARGLLRFLSNVIEYSYIETNKAKSGLGAINIKNLIEETSASYSFEAFKKGVLFFVHLDENVPAQILSDEIKLRHIILNLIGNAIKFTRSGYVKLVIKVIHANPPKLSFSVIDTGIGIEEENLEKIFEPFEQGDASVRREHGGTGLGLSIVQEYVKDLAGELRISSVIHHGTTVSVEIKLETPAEMHIGPEQKCELSLAPLVVVIGDPTACQWLKEITGENLNMRMKHFSDWKVFAAQMKKTTDPYLLIDADNTEVKDRELEQLRWQDYLPAGSAILSTPLLMHGAIKLPFGVMLESSCPLYPWSLDFSRFKETISPQLVSKSLRILVCDDSEENRIILSEYLKEYSDHIDSVHSGIKCLQSLKAHEYDVLFLDIQMPDMDGLTVAAELQAHPERYRSTPYLIAFTAHTDFYEKQEMTKVGFKYILNKPVSAKDVNQSIAHLIKARPEAQAKESQTKTGESMDERIKRKMAAKKGEYLAAQIEALKNIIEAPMPNLEVLKNYAHKLKGNAGYFEFHDAATMASSLEVVCEDAQGDEHLQVEAMRLADLLLKNLSEKSQQV